MDPVRGDQISRSSGVLVGGVEGSSFQGPWRCCKPTVGVLAVVLLVVVYSIDLVGVVFRNLEGYTYL